MCPLCYQEMWHAIRIIDLYNSSEMINLICESRRSCYGRSDWRQLSWHCQDLWHFHKYSCHIKLIVSLNVIKFAYFTLLCYPNSVLESPTRFTDDTNIVPRQCASGVQSILWIYYKFKKFGRITQTRILTFQLTQKCVNLLYTNVFFWYVRLSLKIYSKLW